MSYRRLSSPSPHARRPSGSSEKSEKSETWFAIAGVFVGLASILLIPIQGIALWFGATPLSFFEGIGHWVWLLWPLAPALVVYSANELEKLTRSKKRDAD